VDLEVLGAPVALGEGETITFHRTLVSSSAEQDLVDGKGGDLGAGGLVCNPGGTFHFIGEQKKDVRVSVTS